MDLQGKRGIWIKLSSQLSSLVDSAIKVRRLYVMFRECEFCFWIDSCSALVIC